jgi:chaperonin GroES
MAITLTPLHDRIVVKRIEEKETVKGGIIVPDTAKEKPQQGEVLAVGAGKLHEGKRIPLDVEVGDRVLFGKYSGTEIKIEDEEYLILREDEVLGKMQRAAKAVSAKR